MVVALAIILTPWDWHIGYQGDDGDGLQVLALGPIMITFDAEAFDDFDDCV